MTTTDEPTAAETELKLGDLADSALLKMREPFPDNQISTLPKPYNRDAQKGNCRECGGYHGLPAVHLDYVGHAALTDRLLDADLDWNWEPLAYDEQGLPKFDKAGGLWIKLTVGGVTRLGYGDSGGKTGNNAVKEAIGDALRNAGMRFGAALALWHKGELHAAEDAKQGRDQEEPPPQQQAPQEQTSEGAVAMFARIRKAREKLGMTSQQVADEFASTHSGKALGAASPEEMEQYVLLLEAKVGETVEAAPHGGESE